MLTAGAVDDTPQLRQTENTLTAAPWASPMVGRQADDILASARVQGSVSLIATPWADVVTRPLAAAAAIDDDPALLDFDQVPLVAGKQVQAIRVLRERTVPVHSGMFMAADAPLLAFVESADSQRFRLLVNGGELVGLVTLSDLQRLPVYSLLFGLAIAVEALLVQWIRVRCGVDPDDWMRFLTQRERERIEDYFSESHASNVAIDRLSCASLGQEVKAALGLGLMARDDERRLQLLDLAHLRNQVCHGKPFAATPELALQVPQRAREADALANWLQQALNEMHP